MVGRRGRVRAGRRGAVDGAGEAAPRGPGLALLLLRHARRDARFAGGRLVLLPDQDRSRWDAGQLAEGLALLRSASGHRAAYLLQAAIAAEHARSPDPAGTAWPRIAALYAALAQLTGSPVVRLNRAVAVAEATGPAAGLALLDGLDLPGYHLLPATRADLLRRLGRPGEAAAEYRARWPWPGMPPTASSSTAGWRPSAERPVGGRC